MKDSDAQIIARAAVDLVAAIGERVEGEPALIGLTMTAVVRSRDGTRLVSVVQERRSS